MFMLHANRTVTANTAVLRYLPLYEGESTENLKIAIKIRTTARLFCEFQQTHGLKSSRQVAVRYYIQK